MQASGRLQIQISIKLQNKETKIIYFKGIYVHVHECTHVHTYIKEFLKIHFYIYFPQTSWQGLWIP